MQFWFTSDLHFYHKNIIKYCNRPFENVEEMNAALIHNWNCNVKKSDSVYIIGDVFFCKIDKAIDILNNLNYNKLYIITGNHDSVINENKKLLLDGGLTNPITFIGDKLTVSLNNKTFFMNHFSHRVWEKSHRGVIHLFGHSHGSLPPLGKSVDVGVDSPWITGKPEYRPFSLPEILTYMEKNDISIVDNHGKHNNEM